MKQIDLGQAISIFANVGVIAGIMFLAYELRQNTAAVQTSTAQGLTDSSLGWLEQIATNEQLALVWQKALTDPDSLTDAESLQVGALQHGQWLRNQSAYFQWKRGSLGESEWELYHLYLCDTSISTNQGGRQESYREATFDNHKPDLTPEFVAFVENCRS